MTDRPQLYLITPPSFDNDAFCQDLAKVLDATPVACLRLALTTQDESVLARAADAVREVAHARDVAVVVADHVLLAERHGLDGVHMTAMSRSVRDARKVLGEDAIVGCFSGASRHDGLVAGEAGADYVSFGPVTGATLGDGTVADFELFEWWSEMVEVPVVAEGGLTLERVGVLAPVTDFFGVGEEIWSTDDPVASLVAMDKAIDG